MYIWTIPTTKQKNNVLSLRAAKGENGTMTTMTTTTAISWEHIDSMVGLLLIIKQRLMTGQTREGMNLQSYYLKMGLRGHMYIARMFVYGEQI